MAGVRGVLVLLVLLLLASCTAGGDPPGSADPSVAPASPSPSRPREVRLDGVDPCTLLTEEQRAELGLDGKPVFDRSPSLLYPGEVSACVTGALEPQAIAVGVGLVTTVGIEFYTAGELAADTRLMAITGFPAAVAIPTQYTEFCTVVVDVAPGQLLDVQVRNAGEQPPIQQDQLCRVAERAAGAVMETLLARR